jgi:peptide-methionine (R)-S-oxide reductase
MTLNRIVNLVLAGMVLLFAYLVVGNVPARFFIPFNSQPSKVNAMIERNLPTTEAEWKQRLTAEQYRILRRKGTERAFTGEYWNTKDEGVYRCAGCNQLLFDSNSKFDSGTGWPSFTSPATNDCVNTESDDQFFLQRTEVLCSNCGGHLGHVFEDGPKPTGRRYCINSTALKFQPSFNDESDSRASSANNP